MCSRFYSASCRTKAGRMAARYSDTLRDRTDKNGSWEKRADIMSRLCPTVLFFWEHRWMMFRQKRSWPMLFLESQDLKMISSVYQQPGDPLRPDSPFMIRCSISMWCFHCVYRDGGEAFFFLQENEGKRMALPNAKLCPSGGDQRKRDTGPASDIKILSDHMQRSNQRVIQILWRKVRENGRGTEGGYGQGLLYVRGRGAGVWDDWSDIWWEKTLKCLVYQ